jgi:hypothetical protein
MKQGQNGPSRQWFSDYAWQLLEDSDCSNRAPTTPTKLQREANEAEAALANHLLEVVHRLHVGDATLATDVVSFKVQLALWRWRHCLHAKELAAFVCQPMDRLGRKSGKVVLRSGQWWPGRANDSAKA